MEKLELHGHIKGIRNSLIIICCIMVLLVLIILAYMSKNGLVGEMPAIEWLVDSAARVIELVIDVRKTTIEQYVILLDSKFVNEFDGFGVCKRIADILKSVWAL